MACPIADSTSTAAIATATAYLPFNGSLMMAVNTTWLLYGSFLVQIYHYYSFHSSKDFWLKFLVAVVAVAGTLHIGFGTATQWGILVQHWGDAAIWSNTPWESALGPFTSGLNGFLVQLFFVTRIVLISKHTASRIAAGIIAVASLLAFSGSIAIMTLFRKGGENALAIQTLKTVMRLWSISTVVCDVLIAATMSLILLVARSQTKFKTTQSLLIRLILQSIETGTVTAITMSLFLICYETMHTNSVYMVWEFASGPLYGNVLVFVLNSRQNHGDRADLSQLEDIHTLSDMITPSFVVSRDLTRPVETRSVNAAVKVTTDVLTQYDSDTDPEPGEHSLRSVTVSSYSQIER